MRPTRLRIKTISRTGHQMALRSFETTRLRVINCVLKAYGGDTVSPWNVGTGMFYFKDCIMEGGVDFYCPRGWAYAEGCQFIADDGSACIWHDGSVDADSKTVLVNCSFSGYDGFKLGRYHRDAQFYLIHCRFGGNMADQDIYLVPTTNVIRWGRRVYYYDCHKKGKEYGWYADNLASAPGGADGGGDQCKMGFWVKMESVMRKHRFMGGTLVLLLCCGLRGFGQQEEADRLSHFVAVASDGDGLEGQRCPTQSLQNGPMSKGWFG